ncbi:MAG: PAS domain-containing protein [Microcoleus sp. SM1_3_4]|nr:PAS domain-containing protein [Microcoleus sp. SM1_3_4]
MQNPNKTKSEWKDEPPAIATGSPSNCTPAMPADAGMVLQLAGGRIEACNPRAAELLGLTAEQLHGNSSINCPWQTVRADGSDFPGETHPPMVALQTGKPCSNAVMGFYRPNGELIWLNLNSVPLFRSNEPIPYAVVTTFTPIADPDVASSQPDRSTEKTTVQQPPEILENISDPVFALDRNWRFTYLNPPARQLLSVFAGDPKIGNSIWEEFPEAIGSAFDRAYRLAASGVTASAEAFYPPHNRWYAARAYPTPSGIAVYFQDVTEQKAALTNSIALQLNRNDAVPRITQAPPAATDLKTANTILRAVIDGTSDVIFVKDLQGRYIVANLAAAEWLATTAAAMLGRDDAALFPPEQAQQIRKTDRQVLETGESTIFEEELPKQGQMRSLLSAKYPWRDAEGNILGVIGISRDITDRQRTEVALEASRETARQQLAELDSIYETAPVGLGVLDRDLRFVRINRQLAEINGFSVEEHLGRTVRELVPDLAGEVEPLLRRVIDTGEPIFDLEISGETASQPGVRRTWRENWYPLKDAAGQITGINIAAQEITERQRIEASLRQSQERIKIAQQFAGAGLWDWDLVADKIWWSQEYRTLCGLDPSVLPSYENWLAQIAQTDRARIDREIRLAIENRTPINTEFQIHHPQHGLRWFAALGNTLCDSSGKPIRAVGISLDITDRQRVEAELLQKNAILKAINDSIPTPIFVKDREGRIIYANPATLQVLGKTEAEVINYRDREIYPQSELGETVTQNDLRIMESGETEVVEESPDGIRTFLGMKTPYRNEAGEIVGLVGISNDITARVQLERDRERILQQEQAAREAAEKANRIKDEFLAVLSHELRTPLNPILGWSKLLLTGKIGPAKTVDALRAIERNAQLQSQLIEDLLDVSRILQGKLSLNVIPVNLKTPIEAAAETVQLAATAKKIQIQTIFDSDVRQVSGDPARLQQIVWNLLSNSVKFTPAGGRIEVLLKQVESRVCIQVIDSGKGIHREFLPYVFEHFRQEDSTTTRKFGGLGLGLAIVKQLVELHGGTINAESPGEGLGATFTVELPGLPQSIAFPKSAIETAAAAESNSLSLTGLRILVVDDEADSRDFIAFILQEAGADVQAVSSAIAACEMLDRERFDLLVSDIGMPRMDGYMLIKKIRTELTDDRQNLPAIALTAYAGETNERQILQAGYQKYLAKPVDSIELVTVVKQLTVDS